MLNFAWNCFRNTGSVDAWMLYSDLRRTREAENGGEAEEDEKESG